MPVPDLIPCTCVLEKLLFSLSLPTTEAHTAVGHYAVLSNPSPPLPGCQDPTQAPAGTAPASSRGLLVSTQFLCASLCFSFSHLSHLLWLLSFCSQKTGHLQTLSSTFLPKQVLSSNFSWTRCLRLRHLSLVRASSTKRGVCAVRQGTELEGFSSYQAQFLGDWSLNRTSLQSDSCPCLEPGKLSVMSSILRGFVCRASETAWEHANI